MARVFCTKLNTTSMKKLAVLVFLLASGFAFAQTKETRSVESFSKLSFRVPGKLILKQGATPSVVLEGDKEFLSKVETSVEGGKLTIGREDKWRWTDWSWRDDNKITYYIMITNTEYLGDGVLGDLGGVGESSDSDLYSKVVRDD